MLTAFLLGFVAFIGYYGLQAAGSIAETAGEVGQVLSAEAKKPKPPKPTEAVYDDSGSGAVSDRQVQAELKSRKAKGKFSNQKSATGKSFAPWMDIDEDLVAKTRADRLARKKRK